MNNNLPTRNILCIDLKSFFASCECIERGLDPFTYPLIVANKKQGNGAISLAVTPFLKKQGVKSRGRLYEIPKNIKYNVVNPRMNLYLQKSKEVVSIYLDFVSVDDLHVYSIDEAFLDVTDYLTLYKKSDYELALEILDTIYQKTGLTATCGIGPNLLLAKISMDVEAKHTKDNIAKWEYKDIPSKLWPITPLSKFWGIGSRLEKKLNDLNIYTIGDLAHYSEYKLKDKFGIIGQELHNHANGIDLSRIKDFKALAKDKSFSHSQVLFKDYNINNIRLIIAEMCDVLSARLRANHKQTTCVGLGISYSKTCGGGFFHNTKIDAATDNQNDILKILYLLLDKYCEDFPIRKVTLSFSGLQDKSSIQLNLFNSFEEIKTNDNYNKTIDNIKDRFGKNSLLKATSLLEDSTAKDRNKKIGGHNA